MNPYGSPFVWSCIHICTCDRTMFAPFMNMFRPWVNNYKPTLDRHRRCWSRVLWSSPILLPVCILNIADPLLQTMAQSGPSSAYSHADPDRHGGHLHSGANQWAWKPGFWSEGTATKLMILVLGLRIRFLRSTIMPIVCQFFGLWECQVWVKSLKLLCLQP